MPVGKEIVCSIVNDNEKPRMAVRGFSIPCFGAAGLRTAG
nr:MAG TPA: hypothetical protein [Caudoviricetes sp.]